MRELLLLMAITANVSVTALHSVVASLPNDPTKEVSSDAWNASHVMTVSADVTGYATVADTGAYADLSGKPVLAAVATSGAYADLSGTPSLAAVATTGSYGSLTSTPFFFKHVLVTGQSTIVANAGEDTLRVSASSNITITTDAGNKKLIIGSAGGSGFEFPVGYVYMSTASTDPATVLGYGTWTAIEGKFLVGVKASDPEFDAGVSGGATGTSYTPSGSNAISLFREASAGTNAASAVTGTVSVEWPIGVPIFAGTTSSAHQHILPVLSTGATGFSIIGTGVFGVAAISGSGFVRVSASASGPVVRTSTTGGEGKLLLSNTAGSTVPAGIISWPATAPSAMIKTATAAAQVFTGVTGSVSGQAFTGNQTNIAILPPYRTVYMWERTA